MNASNFLPMSPAMQRSDAVPSHRELLEVAAAAVLAVAPARPTDRAVLAALLRAA
jgi:hypothetical protein